MFSNFWLVIFAAVSGIISFFIVLNFLEVESLPPALHALKIDQSVRDLRRCMAAKRDLAGCRTAAGQLKTLLDDAPDASFEFHMHTNFSVLLLKKSLILHKQDCATNDVAVDEFHWRIWPIDNSSLPADTDPRVLPVVCKFRQSRVQD